MVGGNPTGVVDEHIQPLVSGRHVLIGVLNRSVVLDVDLHGLERASSLWELCLGLLHGLRRLVDRAATQQDLVCL